MKKQIKSAIVLFMTAVVLAGSQFTASAETPQSLAVNVPFDFVAGNRQFPAGRYVIRRANFNSEAVIRIESADGRVRATVLTNASRDESKRATLTFRQYGDQHFLAVVRLAGAAGGRELQESKQERRLREAAAARRAGPKAVALVECE
jgi:hypothetical protein